MLSTTDQNVGGNKGGKRAIFPFLNERRGLPRMYVSSNQSTMSLAAVGIMVLNSSNAAGILRGDKKASAGSCLIAMLKGSSLLYLALRLAASLFDRHFGLNGNDSLLF